jgi:hypothetical protein
MLPSEDLDKYLPIAHSVFCFFEEKYNYNMILMNFYDGDKTVLKRAFDRIKFHLGENYKFELIDANIEMIIKKIKNRKDCKISI